MYLNNKGSVLIFTLIIFSIISTITMMCIGLNYSNKMIYNLEIKETKLIENALSGIELCSSNIKNEVNKIIFEENDYIGFNEYLLSNKFINSISDISNSHLNNVDIQISSNPTVDENGNYNFKITSTSIQDKYKKKYQASVKIKNPFFNEQKIKYINSAELNIDNSEESDINDDHNIDIINQNIDVNELVIIYDYREI